MSRFAILVLSCVVAISCGVDVQDEQVPDPVGTVSSALSACNGTGGPYTATVQHDFTSSVTPTYSNACLLTAMQATGIAGQAAKAACSCPAGTTQKSAGCKAGTPTGLTNVGYHLWRCTYTAVCPAMTCG
jgi:hypothetical protein